MEKKSEHTTSHKGERAHATKQMNDPHDNPIIGFNDIAATVAASATDTGTPVNEPRVNANGTMSWHQDGKLHRAGDLPAIIWADGTRFWFKHGKLHRDDDQPAVIMADGTQAWYQNGELHRDGDCPALFRSDFSLRWYQNGELHRDGDGPALIDAWGNKAWYQRGKRHRDGHKPAIVTSSGVQAAWFRHGEKYTPTFEERRGENYERRCIMDTCDVVEDDDDDSVCTVQLY